MGRLAESTPGKVLWIATGVAILFIALFSIVIFAILLVAIVVAMKLDSEEEAYRLTRRVEELSRRLDARGEDEAPSASPRT